ncbi:4-(cytidine 5'-diphospho)-2-C-methyl-D-erythritol kinase [Chitinophaga nivalis]|uniref:4-diphosphocytidyl-2-C-methyl-D-erythritol kinase n=1 Tax=Chitinophaga nivalis TaxID=2991709 RepID=A0ABT3ILK4_9BACT|nr:4-(cytidine 5'-diphospho)-2-C-methyl-D-erythritol kinase [Chitinophaga nivalis]MCW3465462.1 4-(cytidine 5'-diphospho)-2-C-methyl-D-erythritol kinase [Chitinophaga nivalis]MCW3484847.1 4-(cytidine 5'-diphospho)-2-C-methyl-D-erythritol kinase [Chitinophaga nivalis]
MIVFPNCKINLGLYITARRADGFHDLETVFYPLPVQDALEVITPGTLQFTSSGIPIPGDQDSNLCLRAFHLLQQDFPALQPVNIHLHKHIPIGAGLGGGSADAAFMLRLLDHKFQLGLSEEQLTAYAAHLGSDCPFFIPNKPCFATGRGEILEPIALDLSGYSFQLIYPAIHVNTGWAFKQLTPRVPAHSLREMIQLPVSDWKEVISNDFEGPVFQAHPVLATIKAQLYAAGARYAAMSGSGSAVVGIFPKNKIADILWDASYRVFTIK